MADVRPLQQEHSLLGSQATQCSADILCIHRRAAAIWPGSQQSLQDVDGLFPHWPMRQPQRQLQAMQTVQLRSAGMPERVVFRAFCKHFIG